MDGKSKDVLKPGVCLIRLTLEGNAFDFLRTYHDLDCYKIGISEMKTKIISLIGFYECYLKWLLAVTSEEGEKFIWKKAKDRLPEHTYNDKDFYTGNFISNSFSECLEKAAEDNKWINGDDKKLISDFNEIRNKIMHFGMVGDCIIFDVDDENDESTKPYSMEIDLSDFKKHDLIISKLFNEYKGEYSTSTLKSDKTLIEYYKSLIK